MNGLEAIELMKQGKMVISKRVTGTDVVHKIEGCEVYYNFKHLLAVGDWEVENSFDFTNSYEEYIERKPLTGWERVDRGENYMAIDHSSMSTFTNYDDKYDDKLYEFANYFSTEEKAEEIRFKQMLFRKLQRFSDENGGSEIDWNDEKQRKYHVKYTHYSDKFIIDSHNSIQELGVVYFMSTEIANQAIELFHDDLIKYFTHDWSGENE